MVHLCHIKRSRLRVALWTAKRDNDMIENLVESAAATFVRFKWGVRLSCVHGASIPICCTRRFHYDPW